MNYQKELKKIDDCLKLFIKDNGTKMVYYDDPHDDLIWPIYDITHEIYCSQFTLQLLSQDQLKAIRRLFLKHLNVYVFSQSEYSFDMFTDFTVVAKSEDDAWEQIKALFKGKEDWDEYSPDSFVNDRSKYTITKLDLNTPRAIAHYSCG